MSLKTATESTPNELYEYLKKSGVKKVEECVWPSLAKEEVTTLNDLNQLTEQDILDIAKQHGLAIMIRRQLLTAKTNLSTQMSATNWDGNTQFERSDNSTPIKKRQEMNSNDKKATYQSISYESASILSNSITNEQVSLSIANGIGQSQHRVRATTKVNTKNSKPKPYPCPNAMIAARNANGDNINANNNGNSNNEELSVIEEKKQEALNDNVNHGFDIDIDSKHTRTSTKRPIIIAHFDTKKTNSILEYHNSIMCIYFTRWEHGNNNNTLITRVFKIDLIIDASKEKKIRLRIVGPLTKINMGMFKCIKYIELENMSLNDLFDIAKQTMNGFKEYNRYLHNCWHFCESFIKMVKLASETAQENDENMEHQLDTMSDISSVIGDSLNANNLNNLNNHHSNNGNEKIGITINDKESKCNKLQAYVTEFFYCCNKNGNNNNNNNNNKNGLFIPIGFEQVSNEFELSEKIDENIIITGYLCKESRALYKWRQRYCVLKTDNILYTYKPKDLKLKHATETISITNAKIKYEKEDQSHDKTEFAPTSSYTIDPNCRFTIITQLHSQTFHFVAQSKQKRQHWIQMIEKYANVRPTGYQQIDTIQR